MPFLRDEGPPIPAASIQKFRESLPLEYGWQTVNETGREVLVVRVPKPKPDYLHDLSEVAFYVGLDTIRNAKDVLLIGHEKCARLEPQLLRDHIRAQGREDAGVVDGLRRSLDRSYGHTFVQSPSNFEHRAFAVRIPKDTVAQFSPDDVNAIRQVVNNLRPRVMECQYAYVLANGDYERLGKRVLLELIGMSEAPAPVSAPVPTIPTVSVPTPAPAPAPAAPVTRTPFPSATPGAFPAAAAAPTPAPAAPIAAPVVAPPVVVPAPSVVEAPAPTMAPEVAVHEEYDIVVSKPTAPAPAPAAPAAAPGPRGALAGATEVHEEFEIVSKPRPAPAPAPSASPLPGPSAPLSALAGATTVEAEYEIVSKPKAAAPVAEAPAEPVPDVSDKKVLHGDKEFEVFTSKAKPKPVPTVTPPGMGGFQAAINAAGYGAASHAPAKTKEYEIIGKQNVVSDASIGSRLKLPSATPGAAPAATMPGLPRAMPTTGAPPPIAAPAQPVAPSAPPAATGAAPQLPHLRFPSATPTAAPAAPAFVPTTAPAPMPAPVVPALAVAPSTPVLPHIHFAATPPPAAVEPTPNFSPLPSPVVDTLPPKVAPMPLPAADNGAPIVPKVTPSAPENALAQRFRDVGYEVVEGLRAQGTVFAFAAHRANGRRVLVKRATEFGPDDAAALAQLVAALGADVTLVIADSVKPGTRLATWGTRVEVVSPTEAAAMSL